MNKNNWTYKKLGEVCKVIMGQSPNGNSVNDTNGIEFHQGKVFFGEKYLNVSNSFTEQPSKIAEPNSVLLCVRAPVGTVNITPRRICIGRGLCSIQPNDIIIMPFLFYALTQKQAYFDKNSTGSTFKAISSKVVINTVLPIPPLAEQERIVAELDLLSSIIEKKKAQLKELDQLAQSIFYDMFGDPITNPKRWEVKILSDICEKITDGTHDTPKRLNVGVKFITGKHIRPFFIDYDNSDYVAEEVHNEIYKRCNPEYGDVLYTNIGAGIGNAALNIVEYEFSMKNVALLKLKKNSMIGHFVVHFLNDDKMKSNIIENHSNGGAQRFLSLKAISKIKIPLPPLPLQQEFADKVEAMEQQKSLIQQSIDEVQTLFDSRMDYWFG
jgi:type I restriction enzyme S subunit